MTHLLLFPNLLKIFTNHTKELNLQGPFRVPRFLVYFFMILELGEVWVDGSLPEVVPGVGHRQV